MATVHLSPIGNGFNVLGISLVQLNGGKVYTYQTGSSTLLATYTTIAGNVQNSNPITLLADGRFPAAVWLVEGSAYRFQFTDALGNVIQTIDNIYGINDLSTNVGPVPSTAVNFLQAGTGAVTRTMQAKERDIVSVKDFGASGDGATNDYAAIQAAIDAVFNAGGGDVYVPASANAYRINTALTPRAGVRVRGGGASPRWTGTTPMAKLDCRGSNGFDLTAAANFENFTLANLWLDGMNAGAGANGLNFDGSSFAISGIRVDDCSITNFPNHQIYHVGTVYDTLYRAVTAHNLSVAADDVVRIDAGAASQNRFVDCFIVPYTAGKWGVKSLAGDVAIVRGAVAAGGGGTSNGIYASGAIIVIATNVEGVAGQTGTIGIQYLGSTGAHIAPGTCFAWGKNVCIGDGTATSARGWVINGNISQFNAAAGNGDVVITAGGSRVGTILNLGFAGGAPTVTNARLTTDAADEVQMLYNNTIHSVAATITGLQVGAGSAGAPSLALGSSNTGLYTAASQVVTSVGGTAEFFVGTGVAAVKAGGVYKFGGTATAIGAKTLTGYISAQDSTGSTIFLGVVS